MKLTITIEGREAIPVRAIPYITGDYLTPDRVFQMLAHKSTRMRLSAHSFDGVTKAPIHEREWDDLNTEVVQLADHARIQDFGTRPGLNIVAPPSPKQFSNLLNRLDSARKKARDKLPARVFVWLDEFERDHTRFFGEGPLAALALDDGNARLGDRALSYCPLLVVNDERLYLWIMEGFLAPATPEARSVVELPADGAAPAATAQAGRGITKQQVMNAFEDLHFDRDHWGKNLSTPPNWLIPCRVALGNKKTSALWNPVLIAAALVDKRIAMKKLDAVFVGLRDWAAEWSEISATFRD